MRIFPYRIPRKLKIRSSQISDSESGSGPEMDPVNEALSRGPILETTDRAVLSALGHVEGITRRFQAKMKNCDFVIKIIDTSASMAIKDTYLRDQDGNPFKVSRWQESCHHLEYGQKVFSGFNITSELSYWPSSENDRIKTSNRPYLFPVEMNPLFANLRDLTPKGSSNIVQTLDEVIKVLEARRRTPSGNALIVLYTDGSWKERAQTRLSQLFEKFEHISKLFRLRVVMRLTTGDEQTIDLYNHYDKKQLAFEFDVLANCVQETKEFEEAGNGFLTSTPRLDELRTLGCGMDLMDTVDEKPLIPSEIYDLVALFLENDSDLSLPEHNPHGFLAAVKGLNESNPELIIDSKKLEHALIAIRKNMTIQEV